MAKLWDQLQDLPAWSCHPLPKPERPQPLYLHLGSAMSSHSAYLHHRFRMDDTENGGRQSVRKRTEIQCSSVPRVAIETGYRNAMTMSCVTGGLKRSGAMPVAALAAITLSLAMILTGCQANGGASDPTPPPPTATASTTGVSPSGSTGPTEATPEATFDPGDRKLVAVSMVVLADIVANIGGERTEVWSVTPPNADPHSYEVTPGDLVRLSDADYLVMVGGRFEGFAERTPWRRAAREAGLPTLVVTDSIDVIVRDLVVDHGDHVHDYTGGDPHFWLDPQRILALIPVVADGLTQIDPEGADYYRAQAERYAEEVLMLDAEMEAAIATIPPERRVLIVQHDAYGYLAARFGFEVLGSVLSASGEGETSAANLVELHRLIDEWDVPAVFREPQLSSTILDSLARDKGIEVGVLMTDAFTPEVQTYLDLVRFNVDSLVTHLR